MPPAAPTLSVPSAVSSSTVGSVTVSGTAEAGATVGLQITDAGAAHTVTGSATADGSGNWSVTGLNLSTLSDGQITYTAAATDAAGNTGPSATQTGAKKTTTATPAFTTYPAKITSNAVSSVQLAGTAEAGVGLLITSTDSAGHSASATLTAGGTGAWSTTLNLAAFSPGAVTFTAKATDAYGNTASASVSSRIGPKVVSISLLNGGAAGTADAGDRVVIVFSEKMSPSSFCSTWTSATGPWSLGSGLNVTIANSGGTSDNLTLTSTGCTTADFGAVGLGAHYSASNTTLQFKGSGSRASQAQLSSDGTTLTITLGALFKGTPLTGVSAGTPSYQPATTGTPTDIGGVPLPTQSVPATSTSRF
ncbi:Ig-like domain-containing protein [Sinomonas sp. 5-5]|uniref:Ig-like domain-containing protein n=1 Tax=Sinomonas terrae TaxID=2908838 RepID=A0ABS9U577_9MICC|nr:Ig-like domain-containing protein [Sinomonas terrae]